MNVKLENKLKLYGFNNLTKTLSFNIYDVCYAKSGREQKDYISYIDEQYNSERLTNILCDVTKIIGANVLNVSKQDYDPQGASVTILITEKALPLVHMGECVVAHLDKSHVTVHTYPEYHPDNSIATFRVDIDVSTCGEVSPLNALDYLIGSFDSDIITIDYRVRGFTRDLHGNKTFTDVIQMAEYAREEINKIEGYYAFGKELINGDTVYNFDQTKLSIHTRTMGLAGIEVYDILRDDYNIQIEFGDIGNILAVISVGDHSLALERLISALAEIKRRFKKNMTGMLNYEYRNPIVVMTPQDAFYADKSSLAISNSEGHISSEFVMCYPPGIPILAPGELITSDILEYIAYAKKKGCLLTGTKDLSVEQIQVVE